VTGEFVAELQRRLDIPTGTAPGTFGPKTEAAVRQWQRDHGLVPDGIFGPRSWEILDRERPNV
jgi:peptidoglycan hydrolase-like protein with peptidoglycan-binding domain